MVPLRALFFGTYDTAIHPRVGVLREGVRSAGVEVLECNAPIGLSTADRVAVLRTPWRALGLLGRLIGCWSQLWRCGRSMGPVDVVIVGYLGHLDVHLARLLFRGVPVVLDHLVFLDDTAEDRGLGGGWKHRVLQLLDRAALSSADLIVVDTVEHAQMVPDRFRDRVVVVPVGAPDRWFHPPTSRAEGPLEVIFFGLYTPLQGAPVIGEALRLLHDRDDVHVTMVGNGQDLDETRRRAGDGAPVTWIEWMEPDQLPDFVAAHDVCLGIFGIGPKSHRVVPNKAYQGAAAGCALITSDTGPQRRALGDSALYVPAGDAAALAAALVEMVDDPEECFRRQREAYELAERDYRPRRVVEPLLVRLGYGDATTP